MKHFLPLKRVIFSAVTSIFLTASVCAQTFPNKIVTLMVPYPAGGLSDLIARKVAEPMSKALGQPVLIENLGGAGGAIAAQKVLNAPADGYYVYLGSPNELILAPLANAAVKYKSEDFRLIHNIGTFPIAILARKDLPASTPDELAAYAIKVAKEGKPMTYASVGYGSFYHILGAQMALSLGAEMTHVPYKGGAPVVQDLLGSQVDMFISPYGAPQIDMVKSGKLKFVGAASQERQRAIPQVPSTGESKALKGYNYAIGTGFYVKKDTPDAVALVLHQAIFAVLNDAEVRNALISQGGEMTPATPLAGTSSEYAKEIAQIRAIAKSIKLEPQ